MSYTDHGPSDAAIWLLGEAPSTEELRHNEPFVGPAGEVLNRCLLAAGIDRSDCRIVNTFPFRCTKDAQRQVIGPDKAILWKPLSGLTAAGKEASAHLWPLLAEGRPKVIVPLGGTALSALLPDTKGQIGKWRGSILSANGVPAVPTYHPATVVWGSTHLQHVIATDLRRVKEIARHGHTPRPRRFILNPSHQQAMAFIAHLQGEGKRVNFDLELFGKQLSAISLANTPEEGICIPFIDRNRGQNWTPPQENALLSAIFSLLSDPAIPKCNQNITFDTHILATLYGAEVQGQLDDPMVLHSIALPDLEKGLGFLASWLTDVPYYKDDGGKRAWENPWQNIEAFWRYSALDSMVSLECFEKLEEEFLAPASPWRSCYEETMAMVKPIVAMMLKGFAVDLGGVKTRRRKLAAALKRLDTRLAAKYPGFNPASPKQCAKLFYETLGHTAYKNKTGGDTTDVFALKRLARKGVAEAKTVLARRGLVKRIEFMETCKSERIVTSYNIRGAKTGRLASEASELDDSSRNLQNITGELRAFMRADDPEHILLELDCAGAEWFIVGYIGRVVAMIEAHRRELDPHSLTASRMFACTYLEAKADSDAPEGLRQRGKRCNHSLNYGLGWDAFSIRYDMTAAEAKELRRLYHAAYPEVEKGFWAYVKDEILRTGALVNCFGRVRTFLSEPGPLLWLDAYAHLPQSTVYDLTRLAMVEAYHLPQVQLRSQDHDAITLHLRADPVLLAETVECLGAALRTPLTYSGETFSLGVDAKIGYTRGKKTMVKVTDDAAQCREAIKHVQAAP